MLRCLLVLVGGGERVGAAGRRRLDVRPGLKAYYLTHPETKYLTPALGCDAKNRIFDRLSPATGVPAHWFWDGLHVLSILNRHFNLMLLETVREGRPPPCGKTQTC